MRALLISSALVAALAATPVVAQSDCVSATPSAIASEPLVSTPPETPTALTPLAPLATDSVWRKRFEAAGDALFAALRSGETEQWQPLLGGRWLSETDRQAVETLIGDRCGAFAPLLAASGPIEQRIFGWSMPASYSASERAHIAARPEAEALLCWSMQQDANIWPQTAADADNRAGRPYACARIAYSVRDGTPRWRAFVERG